MQLLQELLQVAFLVAYTTLCVFAIYAICTMHRQSKAINDMDDSIEEMQQMVRVISMLTMGSYVQNCFREINGMKNDLHSLIRQENFEAAAKLQDDISTAEKHARESLEKFKAMYGDSVDIIRVTNTHTTEE